MTCHKDNGSIKLIRHVHPSQRYVGRCADCGWETEPCYLGDASRLLRLHATR